MTEFRKILVPVDFSGNSHKAIDVAIGLAKTFDSELHVLHAYHPVMAAAGPDGVVLTQSFWDGVRDAAQANLNDVLESVSEQGVKVEGHLTANAASAAIEAAARELEADLIVMGTRGLTGLKHVLLGSVAERTVRTAPCPVMTVKEDHE